MKVSCHCSRPLASSVPSSVRQASSQTPRFSQSPRRRQQVTPLGYSFGTSRQRAPVRSTHRMPSKHARLSAVGRPCGCFRFRLGAGSNGSITDHWASVSCVFMPSVEHAFAHDAKSVHDLFETASTTIS
jgi:hypothetical protein